MSLKAEAVYGALTKYVQDSLEGVGALRGAPCTIQSISEITGGNRVTFSWKDASNVTHTQTLDVMNGTNTTAIDDTETSNAKTWSSGKIYNELNAKVTSDEVESMISDAIGGALNGSY